MATKKPPRPWKINDLLRLGTKTGATYLKAVPVLYLENWVRGERKEGRANFVKTKDLANRLESSKAGIGFSPSVTMHISGALLKIQRGRNLVDPPLIEFEAGGIYRINLPHYEPLLQKYRQVYRERYPEDYKRLFPESEPDWGLSSLPKTEVERKEMEPMRIESEGQDKIQSLLRPLERALRGRQEAIDRLTEENQRLQAELVALQVPERKIVDEELRNDCVELLKNEEYYIDAIRRAGVVLETRLRKTLEGTGAGKLGYGAALVKYALGKDKGKLIISEHPNEQDGVYQLFSGAFAFVRNPPAHKKVQYTELEAWQTISLIDYLLLLLRQAKPRKT